jgi:hypothetical protein
VPENFDLPLYFPPPLISGFFFERMMGSLVRIKWEVPLNLGMEN